MDDESASEKDYPLTPAKLSKTPSWIMLGFILGALFVWMLPRDPEPAAAPEATRRAAPAEPPRTALTTLTTIEAVFEAWGQHAVWDNDLTEVALWNSATKSFSECYEVRRTRDAYYFRSIPKLTRLVIRHGKPLPDSPLQFTETEEQYREWKENGRTERPAERTADDVKFRGMQVFDLSKLAPVRTPIVVPPPAPPLEKPSIEVPPKP